MNFSKKNTSFRKTLSSFLLDTLFPIHCLTCGQYGKFLCENCLRKISLKKEQVCPICEKVITPNGYTCFNCKKKNEIDGLLICAPYEDRAINLLIHVYKYRFIKALGSGLGEIMLRQIMKNELPLPDLIIPIPLHPRRLRWRGFNQSELIARHLAENILPGIILSPDTFSLQRKKFTSPQMKIKNLQARQKNVSDAFEVPPKQRKKVKQKRIWLIDDVATTGSTIFAAAKTLKKSGAREVFGLVVARHSGIRE